MVNRGVGTVERNIAGNITILSQENAWIQQKTNTILAVVVLRKDSKKRSIVPVVTLHIVPDVGKNELA